MGVLGSLAIAANTGIARAAPDVAAVAPAASDRPARAHFGMRNAAVTVYLLLAAVALAPGVILWLLPDVVLGVSYADRLVQTLRAALVDIRFGGGLRFWLGVVGAAMMSLLLLYPVRKMMAKRRWPGSVGGWFHLHTLFGIAGPVLILYHCNFGHGAPDANVALWSMLAVAGSGIVGQFIYATASATFYADKQAARAELDAILANLAAIDALHPSLLQIGGDLEAFDAELLTPRRGIMASAAARVRMERRRASLARAIAAHLAACAEMLSMSEGEQVRLHARVGTHFGAYMRTARHAGTRSVREQIWARWRLFHLPAFLIMLVAMSLHIAAVWDWSGVMGSTSAQFGFAAATARQSEPQLRVPIAPQEPTASAGPATKTPETPWRGRRVRTVPIDVESDAGATQPLPPPSLKIQPTIAKRMVLPGVPTPPPVAAERADPPHQNTAVSPPTQFVPAPPPVVSASKSTDVNPTVASDAIAELQRRFDVAPMGLGTVKPRTLAQQIAELKLKQQNKQFSHSGSETGFALTGRHKSVECADCHTKPLSDPVTPGTSPRQCVNCHKKDDVHRGRRLNCASCHTTSKWSEIIRQRN